MGERIKSKSYFKTLQQRTLSFWAPRRISHCQQIEILHFVQNDSNGDFEIASVFSRGRGEQTSSAQSQQNLNRRLKIGAAASHEPENSNGASFHGHRYRCGNCHLAGGWIRHPWSRELSNPRGWTAAIRVFGSRNQLTSAFSVPPWTETYLFFGAIRILANPDYVSYYA